MCSTVFFPRELAPGPDQVDQATHQNPTPLIGSLVGHPFFLVYNICVIRMISMINLIKNNALNNNRPRILQAFPSTQNSQIFIYL